MLARISLGAFTAQEETFLKQLCARMGVPSVRAIALKRAPVPRTIEITRARAPVPRPALIRRPAAPAPKARCVTTCPWGGKIENCPWDDPAKCPYSIKPGGVGVLTRNFYAYGLGAVELEKEDPKEAAKKEITTEVVKAFLGPLGPIALTAITAIRGASKAAEKARSAREDFILQYEKWRAAVEMLVKETAQFRGHVLAPGTYQELRTELTHVVNGINSAIRGVKTARGIAGLGGRTPAEKRAETIAWAARAEAEVQEMIDESMKNISTGQAAAPAPPPPPPLPPAPAPSYEPRPPAREPAAPPKEDKGLMMLLLPIAALMLLK